MVPVPKPRPVLVQETALQAAGVSIAPTVQGRRGVVQSPTVASCLGNRSCPLPASPWERPRGRPQSHYQEFAADRP